MREPVQTNDAPAAIGPYSQAIRCDGWVYCSGQVPLDPATGKMVEGDIAQQARRVLENLGAVLKAAGADYSTVVKTTVFLTDLNNFQVVNGIYAEYFDGVAPARATVEVSRLPADAQVEMDAVAHLL